MDQLIKSYPINLPSDELICFPFLDTGSDEERQAARDELLRRGYPSWIISLLRRVAGVGLWYQTIAWDWGSLGIFDVLLGYSAILLVASPFPVVFLPELSAALFLAGIVSLATALAGLRWRRSRLR